MKEAINNHFYDQLHQDWYQADNHPIAILRAEQKVKNPWVKERILKHFNRKKELNILDIGCGAGFLTNYLAQTFTNVSGIDQSQNSLNVAHDADKSGSVYYLKADAYELPFEDQTQDVVCAMDFLEHVENPEKVVSEAARVLKPGGQFFFHTFNRNFISWLIVIKCMEWFMPNTPANMHVLDLFIKPGELDKFMQQNHLISKEWIGIRPQIDGPFIRSFFKRKVEDSFSFTTTKGLMMGYMGVAIKESN